VVEQRGYGKNHHKLNFQTFGEEGEAYNIMVAPMIEFISA
jgi:hypothetical protein